MHDCASILDSIAKGTSCFHYFSHGASLHRHSFSRMIFTLVSHIFIASRRKRIDREKVKWRRNFSCFLGRCICCCCFIIWVDFMKGSCAWESEEGRCVNCCLQTYQSSCRSFYLTRRIIRRRGRKRGFADFHIYL